MSELIPESYQDLIAGPVFASLTTVAPDGMPENSIVWCSLDGDHVLVNTVRGRRKARNVERNPRVALIAVDPKNPYRWIDVRGVVEEIVADENYANINAHARLYAGVDQYYGGVAPAEMKGKEDRIIFRIRPDHVVIFPPQG